MTVSWGSRSRTAKQLSYEEGKVQGWLLKRGAGYGGRGQRKTLALQSASEKRRFFVLSRSTQELRYYAEAKSTATEKGMIGLRDVIDVRRTGALLELVTPNRTWGVRTDGTASSTRILDAIEKLTRSVHKTVDSEDARAVQSSAAHLYVLVCPYE